jgi:hypothetical protein
MQWLDVAHAEEIEQFTPLILNQVASVGRGRRHRLRHREWATRLGPFSLGDVGGIDDGAPTVRSDPMTMPVRGFEYPFPQHLNREMACSMAT